MVRCRDYRAQNHRWVGKGQENIDELPEGGFSDFAFYEGAAENAAVEEESAAYYECVAWGAVSIYARQVGRHGDVPKCMLGIAAKEFTTSPRIHMLSALSCRTVSRKPYSFGSRRGGMVGEKVKVIKANRLVKVSVRRATAKTEWFGAT